MIDGLLIINDSGALLFSWHPDNYEGDGNDDLFSGFLTAINSFATIERGEDIKSLKLKETSLIFEKYDELEQKLTFVITTKNEELIELLHAIIHEVMDKFTELYVENLNKNFDGAVSHYYSFKDQVILIMNSFGLDMKKLEKLSLSDALKEFMKMSEKIGMAEKVKIQWESEKSFIIESVNCSTAQVRSVMTKEE
ncbi:MAG: hypothetical protein KGD68_14300 [Candidatus Lokiarchaeota archaeon]|nr:hypothetical protein [Candidatus Lokiarchaeota archaeon]